MACSALVCCNVSLSNKVDLRATVARARLGSYGGSLQLNCCCNLKNGLFCNVWRGEVIGGKFRVPWMGFDFKRKAQDGLCWKSQIRAVSGDGSGEKLTRLGKRRQNGKRRRRWSLRLRPRMRLFMRRVRRVLISAMLSDFVLLLRKNIKKVVLSMLASIALGMFWLSLIVAPRPKVVPYSDLITSLQNGLVTKVLIEEGTHDIYFNTNDRSVENNQISVENVAESSIPRENVPETIPKDELPTPEWQYSTRKVKHDEKFLFRLLREKGATYGSAPPSLFRKMGYVLVAAISLWIPLIPLAWALHRRLTDANSPAKKRKSKNLTVGFDDVEGVDSAKVELMEIVSCLQGAINYKKLGAKLPRGVLLVGPPGTGKTLLARAVAGEAGVPFFSCSASEFVELYVGTGAARVRELFKAARKDAPSIIFIDELDAVGGKRGRSTNDERDQTLNQLLTEMDGFESEMKVIVISATNRPETLDPALCRPGRFSRKVLVGEPDEEGRRKILAVHLREIPLEEDIQLICDLAAILTPGLVGADLANIVNEAALLAARRDSDTVAREDIMEAIERAKYGINDKLRPSMLTKEIVKLFPWMPSIKGRYDTWNDGGYQALS